MHKYTYTDVIIDPTDPRVEIGKEYYSAIASKDVLDFANHNEELAKLIEVDPGIKYPFHIKSDCCDCWTCLLIRQKEPSYVERQEKWIADNGIKAGDKVRIVRKADSNEDGWGCKWVPNMDEAVGKVGTVSHFSANFRACGIEIDVPDVGEFLYPYFVLEKVEQKYVPFDFDNPEVRKGLMGKTIINNYGLDGDGEFREVMIVGFMNKSDEDRDCWSSNGDTKGTIAMTVEGYFHADEFLKECTFLDGTPCGKLVEVEE